MPDKIKPEVTFFFRGGKCSTFNCMSLKESPSGYHIYNVMFPFQFLKDVEVRDPDDVLGLKFAI